MGSPNRDRRILAFLVVFGVSVSYLDSAAVKLADDGPKGLYNSSDYVEELTANDFDQKIYGSERIWLVEFYNTWCGHCQRYAPTYKGVAEFFKYSKDLFVVAAIDCANEMNQQLCRNFEIMGYPTLRYFHERYEKGEQNLGMTVEKAGVDDVDGNVKVVVETLMSEQKNNRALMLPELSPYKSEDHSKVFGTTTPEVDSAFLILEGDNSLLGVETTLTFHNLSNLLVRYSRNKKLVENLDVVDLPTVIILKKQSGKVTIEEKVSKNVKQRISTFLRNKSGMDVEEYLKKAETAVRTSGNFVGKLEEFQEIKKMGDVVFQVDLETALRFSLKEIARKKSIQGEPLKALKDYLDVLLKYFPLNERGRYFLSDLKTLASSTDSLKGFQVATLVKESEDVWSTPKKWMGCQGSSPEHRGYPCGVWTMFHYLTVNSAAKTEKNPEVLKAMHGYIKYFFGCADCSQHFQEMSKERKLEQVSTPKDSVMWLWEAHNEVNKRLAGDATEDPEFPKKQFPTPERCPGCRFGNGTWNLMEVENYLRHVYGDSNVRHETDPKVLHMGLQSYPGDSSGGISLADSFSTWMILTVSLYLGYIHAGH